MFNYFPAYDADDTGMLTEIENAYSLYRERMAMLGFTDKIGSSFEQFDLYDTFAEFAWRNAAEYRESLWNETAVHKEAPAEYQE